MRSPSALQRAARLPMIVLRALFIWDRTDIGDRWTHIAYLAIFAAVVTAPALLSFDPARSEHVWFGSVELPGMCMSREIFNASCPGCNLTRAFVCIAHGEFREAIHQHRASLPLYVFFLGQIVFRGYCLWRRGRPVPWTVLGVSHYAAVVMIAMLFGNWIAGLFLGGNGS
jgi:hypothetical protein